MRLPYTCIVASSEDVIILLIDRNSSNSSSVARNNWAYLFSSLTVDETDFAILGTNSNPIARICVDNPSWF